MTDNSYGISVSTVKDLVVARRVNLRGQARYVGGQISDESYQRTIHALTQLDQESARSAGQDVGQPSSTSELNTLNTSGFLDRYGHGFKLSPPETCTKPSEDAL